MTEKCYSLNDEDYRFDDLNDLLQELEDNDELVVGTEYWEAEARRPKASDFFSADEVLERANECAGDEGGDWAEDFAMVSDDAKAELESLLSEWAEKNCPVLFFTVHAPVKKCVTAELIAEFHGDEIGA